MDEIIKLIETKPHFGKYYLIEERGKKEEMDTYVAYISAKNVTSGHLVIYDKENIKCKVIAKPLLKVDENGSLRHDSVRVGLEILNYLIK